VKATASTMRPNPKLDIERAIDAAAETFRPNPPLDVGAAITELKVGEALVSLLQADGAPAPVERTLIKPPRSRIGPLSDQERAIIRSTSPADGKYDTPVDRESAGEVLKARADAAAAAAAAERARLDADKAAAAQAKEQARIERERRANPSFAEEVTRQLGRSVQRQAVNRIAGQIVRGILGGLFRGR